MIKGFLQWKATHKYGKLPACHRNRVRKLEAYATTRHIEHDSGDELNTNSPNMPIRRVGHDTGLNYQHLLFQPLKNFRKLLRQVSLPRQLSRMTTCGRCSAHEGNRARHDAFWFSKFRKPGCGG